jgi:hypothetical protein
MGEILWRESRHAPIILMPRCSLILCHGKTILLNRNSALLPNAHGHEMLRLTFLCFGTIIRILINRGYQTRTSSVAQGTVWAFIRYFSGLPNFRPMTLLHTLLAEQDAKCAKHIGYRQTGIV